MIYTLKCGNCVGEVSTKGAEMVAFRKNGNDALWQGDPEIWDEHSPLLFPFCCLLKDNKVLIEGKQYAMGAHGFIRFMEFEVECATDTHIELVARSNKETLKMYPYEFVMRVTHDVNESGFSTEFKVQNPSDREIKYCIGAHPGFYTGSIEDWQLVFDKPVDQTLYYTTPERYMDLSLVHSRRLTTVFELRYEDFAKNAFMALEPDFNSVRLVNKHTGKGYEFSFNNFSVFAMWTSSERNCPYICLEPWNGVPAFVDESGNFEDKPYLQTLAPNEERAVSYSVKLI